MVALDLRKQHGEKFAGLAVPPWLRLTIGRAHGAVAAQPRGVLEAAGKTPFAGDAVAAVADHHPGLGVVGTGGQHRAAVADDGTGDLRTDVGRRHREARALADAPRDARIALRERLDHLKQGRGLDLLAVIGARDQQAEQPRVMQRIEHTAEWKSHGIKFVPCECTTSDNYLSILPLLLSGRVRLLDNTTLRTQLAALERHVGAGDRETVSRPHHASAHDDLATAACGALLAAAARPAYNLDAFADGGAFGNSLRWASYFQSCGLPWP